MTKFMPSTARVQIVTVVLVVIGIVMAINDDDLPDDVVSELINNYLKPVIKNIKINTVNSNNAKNMEESDIVQAIEQKVNELRLPLDDSKPEDNDTQILEVPKPTRKRGNDINEKLKPEPLESHINKYKQLRYKIDQLLKTEAVSNRTNSLITETLDQMIAEMLSGQCVSNHSDYRKDFQRHSSNNKEDMVHSWRAKWNKLLKQYSAASNKDPDGLEYKEMFTFLIKLREFFFEIHDELNRQNDRYKLKCQVVNSNTDASNTEPLKKFSVVKGPSSLRGLSQQLTESDDNCKNIKICAEELKSFLKDFYINLQETVDVMFKNYEAMYITDITADNGKKRSFVALLRDINTEINEKISKTFKKKTEKLKLSGYDNAQEKINAIKIFVKSTVDLIERLSGKIMSAQLKSLGSKMRLTVKEDLATTLSIELSNLNKDFSDKICLVFLTCNGSATRKNFGAGKRQKAEPNEVYFKVQMGFPKAHMRRSGNEIRTLSDEAQDRGYNRYYQPPTERTTGRTRFNARRYMATRRYNMIVTRTSYPTSETTVQTTTTKSTTRSTTETTTKTTAASTTKSTTTNKKPPKIIRVIRRTIQYRPRTTTPTTTTTSTTTMKPETTTTKITETTYTYGEYVRKMIALGKISPNPKWQTLLNRAETTEGAINKLMGSFIY